MKRQFLDIEHEICKRTDRIKLLDYNNPSEMEEIQHLTDEIADLMQYLMENSHPNSYIRYKMFPDYNR